MCVFSVLELLLPCKTKTPRNCGDKSEVIEKKEKEVEEEVDCGGGGEGRGK